MSPQYVEVKFKTNTKDKAEKMSSAIIKVINAKVKALSENSEQEISFYIENKNPIIVESKPNVFLNSIIGLVSGLILGIFIVFGKEYFSF
jgi:capsular polysaccharide biosynthesis protein